MPKKNFCDKCGREVEFDEHCGPPHEDLRKTHSLIEGWDCAHLDMAKERHGGPDWQVYICAECLVRLKKSWHLKKDEIF